jgi:hypothetical protein
MGKTLQALFLSTAAAALAGCGGGGSDSPTPPPPPPSVNTSTAITGTAAYGVLGTSTARVAFVPAGNSVVPVMIEGTGTISSGLARPAAAANAVNVVPPSVAISFPVSACAVDSNDLKAACIGYNDSHIAFLDLHTFATSLKVADIGVQEFDSGAGTVPNSYSGGECVVCGVAMDVGKQRFVIGGTGGFRVFAYGATTPITTYNIPVGENFGFLPQPNGESFIIAPEYEPNAGNRKLRVVNLETGKVYVWTKNTDSVADLGADASNFQRWEVDAAAIDINTKMITLTTEDSADFLLVDFGQATFDQTALTFSAPFKVAKPNAATNVPRQTDVAVSTTGDVLLSHGEGTGDLGVLQLPTAAGSGGNFPAGVGALGTFQLNDPNFDHSACGTSYFFIGKMDPHGLGLYAGVDQGQRGLIVDNDNSCAAVVDLAAMLAAPRQAADPNAIDTTNSAVKAAVKFVKLQ